MCDHGFDNQEEIISFALLCLALKRHSEDWRKNVNFLTERKYFKHFVINIYNLT